MILRDEWKRREAVAGFAARCDDNSGLICTRLRVIYKPKEEAMKHLTTAVYRKIGLGVTLVFALLLYNSDCLAQTWGPGEYMQQALSNVIVKATVMTVASDSRYDLNDNGVCLLGAFLEDGAHINWETTLMQGHKYVFIGGGDEDVEDLDIKVYDSDGDLVKEDVQEDNSPIVELTPAYTARYTIQLKLYDAPTSSFSAMAILREGVQTIPLDRVTEAMDRYLKLAEAVNEHTDGASFHDESNQWALFGAILDEGESTSISNMNLETRQHAIIAAGDNSCEDADLYLYNTNDIELEKDTESDPTPVISRRTSDDARYKLIIKNYDSNGRSLIIATILDL